MADDDGGRGLECVQQAHHVADQMEHRVLVDRLGCIALAIAAHVRRHRVEAGRGERIDLMTPRIPGFGKAVAHQHQWPFALFGDVEADAVALDDSLRWFAHVPTSWRCSRARRIGGIQYRSPHRRQCYRG
jgi:hypothetical protein